MPDYPPLGLESEFPFGKHKGETVEDVLRTDRDYIQWAIDEGICFTKKVEDEL